MGALAVAQRLIDKNGGLLTISRVTQGQFDPSLGRRDNDSTLSQTVRGVVLAPSGGGGDSFDQQTTTRTQYRTIYVAGGLSWTPEPADIVTFPDGTTGTIKGVSTTAVTGDPSDAVLHELTVQR